MNKANECTCPSGDGSLVHPCPAHPAVEQAGTNVGHGHVFPRADGVKMRCGGPALCSECAADAYRARAALAQPSGEVVVTKNESGAIVSVTRQDKEGRVLSVIAESATLTAQAEKAEVVARVVHSNPVVLGQCGPLNANDELMTVAQHAASVARWAEMFNRVEQQRDAALAEVERLRQFERICEGLPQDAIDGGWTVQGIRGYAKRLEDQLKAALARVADMKTMADNYCALLMDANAKLAEMERQEPVALANRGLHAFWVKWTEAAAGLYGPGIKLYAAPVAQAQHSVPEISGIGRDAEHPRAVVLYLRNEPSEEDMRAIQNFLRAISADVLTQAQHSVPDGWLIELGFDVLDRQFRFADAKSHLPTIKIVLPACEVDDYAAWELRNSVAARIEKLIAAAPGNSVPQAWLDVQAERRRQITAEGWTPEHDDEHADGQMARAAACYALAGSSAPNDGTAALLVSLAWPWDEQWWKPSTARRDLVKACALALAEIERLDRAAPGKEGV
ncbi:hypothetical protein ACIRTX_12725 [Pseudomonas aeruginosa]|uniref:hypothetical protein n=5 Tax=Pseudomonas aeruginosa TaxID=287 RepID=UPI0021007F5A|nr:hypothetical protein [Pseudomonas aeruginosa]